MANKTTPSKIWPWYNTWPCTGTDLNRNWEFHYAEIGSSTDACSQIYHGTGPFSEIENRNVRDFIWAHKVILITLSCLQFIANVKFLFNTIIFSCSYFYLS